MTSNIIIGIASVLLISYLLLRRSSTMSSSKAHQLVEAGARLVDVRTPQEFASDHIAGAVNIPVQDLGRRMVELERKEQPIILYCRSGARSSTAAQMLKSAGYTQIHNLGPMSRW